MAGVRAYGRRRWALFALAAAVLSGVGVGVLQLQSGQAKQASVLTATASRGALVVAVGGVGRIVQATASSDIAVPGAAGSSGSSAPAPVSSSPDAVFARAAGRVARFFVAPGGHVAAGQALAVLDDGGTAAAAVRQARSDLATALLDLRQKQTSDPLRGLPPSRAELAAARAAVATARARLQRLLRPLPADVAAARLDVRRAEADLETLLGGTQKARDEATQIAQQNVEAAQDRLDRILAPPNPADVSLAEADLKRAVADLATLQRPSVSPSPEALVTAQQAISAARAALLQGLRSGDGEAIAAGREALESALADLTLLLKPGPGALPQQVEAAQAAVESARAKLERLLAPANPADVATAQLEVDRAEADLRARKAGPSKAAVAAARQAIASARARLARLLGPPLASDVAAARLEVRRAESDLAVLRTRGGPASKTDIELARLRVDAARARLSTATFAEGQLTVRAPRSGTVTSLLTVRGAPVDGTTPIAMVSDLSRLAATVDLSEFDAALVKRGLDAIVSVDALGGKAFRGKVRFSAFTGTNNGGVVTFPVQVDLGHPRGLKPGMNVSVRIIVAQRRNVVRIPLEAVTRDGEDHQVVTVLGDNGRSTSRRVRLGLANNQSVQILRGLRAGERVVLPAVADGGGADEEA